MPHDPGQRVQLRPRVGVRVHPRGQPFLDPGQLRSVRALDCAGELGQPMPIDVLTLVEQRYGGVQGMSRHDHVVGAPMSRHPVQGVWS